LASSHSLAAYQSIVYKKGAVVLDMMSRLFEEERFLRILREIVRVTADRVISTEGFVTLVERIGGVDLQWFARQYVFGTGLPSIYYRYTLEPGPDGRWLVEGEVRQQAPHRSRTLVVGQADGQLEVRTEAVEPLDVSGSTLVVPFEVGLAARPGVENGTRSTLGGQTVIQGARSTFRFEIDDEPELLWLDRQREVLARFICETRWPRRAAFHRGADFVASGEPDRAEATLRRALDETIVDVPDGWLRLDPDEMEQQGRVLEARIHLTLARLYLDQGRLDPARVELDLAEGAPRRSERHLVKDELVVLSARLAFKEGRADQAYRMLRKRFGAGDASGPAEGFALLAVAARATGHEPQYHQACRQAVRRGVDLGPLECPHPRHVGE